MFNDPNTPNTQLPQTPLTPTPPPAMPPIFTPSTGTTTPTPPLSDPKTSKKKLLIVGGSILLAAALTVGGAFYVKTSANSAAKNYALAIDAQLDSFFKESDRAKRLDVLKKKVTLASVPLGETLSEPYKNAKASLTPLYDETLTVSKAATEAQLNNRKDFRLFTNEYLNALTINVTSTNKQILGINVGEIEGQIEKHFKVADQFNVAADTLEKATFYNKLPSFEKTINEIRALAKVRQEHAVFAAQYYKSVIQKAGASMDTRVEALILSHDKDILTATLSSDEIAAAPTKIKQLTQKYIDASKTTIDTIETLTDEILKQSEEATKKVTQLDEKLKEFATKEELSKE